MTSILKVDNIRDSSDNQAISISNGVVTFANDVIPTDNVSDLGTSSSRYKDLFLSGGAYIGGTGSANYLDDYEEGDWTPIAMDGSGNTGSTASADGTYTKIGRLVNVNGFINVNGAGSTVSSNGFQIGGLPFTIEGRIDSTSIEASGSISFWNNFATGLSFLSCSAIDNVNRLALYGSTSSTVNSVINITWANVGTSSANFRFSMTYLTSE